MIVKNVEKRPPSARQFGKTLLDKASRALRPRIDSMPEERARESCMRSAAEPLTCLRAELDLLDRPLCSGCGIAVQMRGRESIEQAVIGGISSDQLALKVGR